MGLGRGASPGKAPACTAGRGGGEELALHSGHTGDLLPCFLNKSVWPSLKHGRCALSLWWTV